MEKMIATLTEKITENNFKEFNMEMTNGDVVTITPCSYFTEITSIDQIEYYLVAGKMPWMGGDSIEKIAKQFVNYEKRLTEDAEEKEKLRAYFEKHILPHKNDPNWKACESDDFGYYSDWHKDLYGFRPRGFVCGSRV